MDSEFEELHLMKLKRLILDEDKIVTAVWFSREYNINIQDSHALLKQFIDDEKSSSPGRNNLGVSYILIGTTKKNSTLTIMIVKHDQLDEKRKLFKQISSEQVHSIQRAKDVNFNVIGLVDMFQLHGDNATLAGCIVSKNCVLRMNMPDRSLPAVTRIESTDKSKASHLFANRTKQNSKAESASLEINPNVKTEIDKEANVANTAEKKGPVTKQKSDEKIEKKGKLAKQNSGDKKNDNNSIASMFARAPPPKEKSESLEVEPVKAIKIDHSNDDDGDNKLSIGKSSKTTRNSDLYDSGTDEEAKKVEATNNLKTNKGKVGSKKKTPRRKREQDDTSMDRAQKKRKRIIQPMESDEDIFADEEDEENEAGNSNVIISDDESTSLQQNNNPKTLAPKNKRRKYVDKTYTDEEGYVVTKKELVYESAESEDDKENPPKEVEIPKQIAKEVKESSAPNKRKKQLAKTSNQPSVMNFFKKK